jgi:hypothetical protein
METRNDLISPANEKLETNILDKTLAKAMTLYHGTDKELDTIKPTSWNMGTRLSPKARKSSFWTKNFDYAVVWALDWVAIRGGVPYFHDIERKKFVIPSWDVKDKDGKVWWLYDWILESLRKQPVYVYEAVVPTKDIGRGQLAIDEYTVDTAVTPTKKTAITPEIAKKYLMWAESKDFNAARDKNYGVYSKLKTGILEKVLFKDSQKVISQRKSMYENKKSSATESFIQWCDEMYIANESSTDNLPYKNGDIIGINFFGKPMKVKVHIDERDKDSALINTFDRLLKSVGSSNQLWGYLYNQRKKMFDEVNKDPYYDGKTCKSGKDLINSVGRIDYIGISRDIVYICGEYWIDDEHGFSISFPNGKFVRLKDGEKLYDTRYIPIGTVLGQYADAL